MEATKPALRYLAVEVHLADISFDATALRGRIEVIDVMTRQGLRHWPKSKRSHRTVPEPVATLEAMSTLMAGRPRDALAFIADGGQPVSDANFRNRVGIRP